MTKTETPPMMSPPSPELTERRYVYNGHDGAQSHDYAVRGNRPVRRRKQSSFTIIALVVMVSFLIVFYVWVKISVTQLNEEVRTLEAQHASIQDANKVLRADINRKSTLGRIEKIAKEQLSMISPKEQPRSFELDQEQFDRLVEK